MTVDVRLDESEATTLVDRRRPGRRETVHPNLLPLLRAEERARWPALLDDGSDPTPADDDACAIGELRDRYLDAGQGVALGVGLGVVLWYSIIVAGRAMIASF